MLFFLTFAAKAGFVVDSYEDRACGIMDEEQPRQALRREGDARPADRVLRRQAALARRDRRAPSPLARGMLHRELGEERGGRRRPSRPRLRNVPECATCPSPTTTAARCWPASASPASTTSSPTCPRTSSSRRRPTCRAARASSRSSASSGGWRRGTSPPSSVPFFVGAGAYKHHVPASVDHLIQRSEFLTSYTPYQPEIAQGTLQYLFEFQTQVANLTAMEVANASMYDGSTGTGRGGADGASRHQAPQGRAVGRAAPAIRRGRAHAVAHGRRRGRLAAAGRRRGRGPSRRDRRHGVLRRRADAGLLRQPARPSRRRRQGARGTARC